MHEVRLFKARLVSDWFKVDLLDEVKVFFVSSMPV